MSPGLWRRARRHGRRPAVWPASSSFWGCLIATPRLPLSGTSAAGTKSPRLPSSLTSSEGNVCSLAARIPCWLFWPATRLALLSADVGGAVVDKDLFVEALASLDPHQRLA